jgi:drug/metabolite transporter (DMT)-like permease
MNLAANTKGLVMAFTGILLLSPDSLLIRLINIDLWTLMFLRGLFMGLSLFLLNILFNQKQALQQFLNFDRYAWGIIVLSAVSAFFFVASIQTTSVAHTLIIVSAIPVVTALLALVLLREKVSTPTLVTILVVATGLIVLVYDDQQSSLLGDLYAGVVCLFWSINFILARKTRITDMMSAMSIAGFLMALGSFPLADFCTVGIVQLMLSVLLGVLVGASLSLLTFAPRYIMAAEVAVFLPLEAVFGSLLVWWILGEYPGLVSLSAGLLIIVAIMLNSYFQITKSSD